MLVLICIISEEALRLERKKKPMLSVVVVGNTANLLLNFSFYSVKISIF